MSYVETDWPEIQIYLHEVGPNTDCYIIAQILYT